MIVPNPKVSSVESSRLSSGWGDAALLTLIFGVLYFYGLGETALVNPDEGRYAEIPREMIATGDYVTPRLDGVLYFEKPPLVYWTVAGFLRVFGPSELALRAAPALFGLAGVLMLHAAARILKGPKTALAAAVVLGSSLLYFALGRILVLDMAVSMLMSTALLCFLVGVHEPAGGRRRWFFHGLYIAAALATLAKGLIGVLLPGAVIFLWLLLFDQWRRLRPFHLPSGAVLFFAITVPWHMMVARRNPGWAQFYFVHEHWDRFTTTEHGRYQPWWFFFPIVGLGLFPWVGCLPPALKQALRGGWARRKENAVAWFCVTWAVFVFLFFSKSQSKLIPYILPVFPPVALLIGEWMAGLWEEANVRKWRVPVAVFSGLALILGVALLVMLFKPGLATDAVRLALMRPNGLVAAIALLAGAGLVPWFIWRDRLKSGMLALAISLMAFFLALGEAQDKVARPGTKEFALFLKTHIRPGDRVFHYHEFFHDFTFYAERTVGLVAGEKTELELGIDSVARRSGRFIDEQEFRRQWVQPERIWVVARRDDAAKLFADPGFSHYVVGETSAHVFFTNQPENKSTFAAPIETAWAQY